MIISASRRTDIPAFFSEWFMNRISDEYCCTINPFNKSKVSRVSLAAQDVDVIVFWTKNAGPMLEHLERLDEKGYKYFFQYTLTGYPKYFEPNTPELSRNIEVLSKLSERIGCKKVIWRYDPIIFSNITDYEYHYKSFTSLVDKLKGRTQRVVISIVDDYRGSKTRLKELQNSGFKFFENPSESDEFENLIRAMGEYAADNGMEIYSCAEPIDMTALGVQPGRCIDPLYIKNTFGIDVIKAKDKGQRKECGCAESKDIGIYDTCMHSCRYCYANHSDKLVQNNIKNHCSHSNILIGESVNTVTPEKNKAEQLKF